MSVYETMFLVDEPAFEAWVERANIDGADACIAQVTAQAREHTDKDVRQWFEDSIDEAGEVQVSDIGDVLMLMLQKRHWPLGNLVGPDTQQLGAALALIPTLGGLVEALDKPQRVLGKLGKIASGLHVVSDTASAAELWPTVNQWTNREQVQARLATVQLPWLARLFGHRKHLIDWTARDSMWERWSSIADALTANASQPGTLLVRQTEV